jgi:uncharacterized protein (DUF433 family)
MAEVEESIENSRGPQRARAIIEALIEKTPGALGGSARIARTRVSIGSLENWRRLGWSDTQILKNYPTLRTVDLEAAWAYVAANRPEIDAEIAGNESA